ncbi:heme-binding protein 2-like [Myripristis murdjan]|uniref:heme-binding protein 2-like n=1 Tax=Myripristis murdjan TaxID=586833 RepID=UPI0011760779|nr:heme-binding protein 2-like [Myripristis murdjan]
MEHRVFMLAAVALVLAAVCTAQAEVLESCKGDYVCPNFTVVEKHKEFEERRYVETQWISTRMSSSSTDDMREAYYRLKDFCEKDPDHQVSRKTWPALISISEDDGTETSVSMSWFVPPGTVLPATSNPKVTVETRSASTVYVKTFGGTPNHELAQDKVKILRKALDEAGKSFDHHTYAGAGYDNPLNIFITHHNEIWIYEA